MAWHDERNTVLNWWPQILAGDKPQGYIFVDSLEDAAWGCQHEADWNNWLKQVEKIWPQYVFMEPLYHRREGTDGIDVHLGPTLGQALFERIHSDNQPLKLTTRSKLQPVRSVPSGDVAAMAVRLRNEFGLKEIAASRSCDVQWLKKQLTDAHLGFANLATLLDIPNHHIGNGTLRLWFHEKSPLKGASSSSQQHIEIHQTGGNVAQTWAWWKLTQNSYTDYSSLISQWLRRWVKGARIKIEHQQQFLDKTQHAYKKLVDQVPVTSEMGQRVFRRYRALCKWIDDVKKGVSLDSNQQAWEKLKTGNRIAWSGEHAHAYQTVVRNWGWEERLVEAAFWRAPQWHIPSWVQRFRALAHDSWVRNEDYFKDEDFLSLWTLGFEAYIRDKIGFDGWIAMHQICHPTGFEAQQFNGFFLEHLFHIIRDTPKA